MKADLKGNHTAKKVTPPRLKMLPPPSLTAKEKTDYQQKLGRLKEIESYWFEAGETLLEIRDQRLYREQYHDFASFCCAELGMGKSNYNRMLRSSQVAQRMAAHVAKPEREAHIRPLLRLDDPVEQEQAYRMAVDQAKSNGKPLTALLVTRAIHQIQDAKPIPAGVIPSKSATKSDLLIQISRALTRDLEALSSEQLQAFAKACLAFKRDWLAALPPAPPADEVGEPQETHEH